MEAAGMARRSKSASLRVMWQGYHLADRMTWSARLCRGGHSAPGPDLSGLGLSMWATTQGRIPALAAPTEAARRGPPGGGSTTQADQHSADRLGQNQTVDCSTDRPNDHPVSRG